MGNPDTELLALDDIDDELGEGVRIYTSQGDIYEARDQDNTESRLYGRPGEWYSKVQKSGHDALDTLERRTRSWFGSNFHNFMVELESLKAVVSSRDKPGEEIDKPHLCKNRYDFRELDKDKLPDPKITSYISRSIDSWKHEAVTGAIVGGAMALAGGPVFLPLITAATYPLFAKGMEKTSDLYGNMDKEQYRELDKIDETGLFDVLNQIQALKEKTPPADPDDDWEYYQLSEQYGTDNEAWDALEDYHFNRFHFAEGSFALTKQDTYQEAAQFAADALDVENVPETPSLYASHDVFTSFLDQLPRHEQDDFVQNALESDELSDEAAAYLDENYPELIENAVENALVNSD